MKYFAAFALFAIFATLGSATAYNPDDDDGDDTPVAEVCLRYLQGVDIKELFLLCLGHGQNFNGRKTCEIGCRIVCAQPGCGGFHKCTQIPNVRLHKYKCECKSP